MRRALVAIAVALVGGVIAAASVDDGSARSLDAPLPAQRERALEPAARAAGCRVRTHRDEGRGHTKDRVRYRTNPPTSGDHDPQVALEGIFDPGHPPDVEQSVHALEHGRILVQYRRGITSRRVAQLETLVDESVKGSDGYHTLLFRNQTRMPAAVAATAWRRSLTCPRMNDRVFDAIRAFRRAYVDTGPEFIP